MRTLADTAQFTRRYPSLRGLEMAPIWGCMALTSFAENRSWIHQGDVIPQLLLFVPAWIGAWLIYRYLNRTFGVVRPLFTDFKWLLFGVVAYYALQITAIKIGLRVDLTAPFFGLWALWFALRDGGFRKHWLLPAIVGFVTPVVVPYPTVPTPHYTPLWWAILWAAFTIASLWDHVLLVRSFNHGFTE